MKLHAEKPIAHGGALTAACLAHGGAPGDWLDLSTGINPVPMTLPAIPATVWHRLPDAGLVSEVRALAARFYGTANGVQPLPAPGTQALIQLLPQLVGSPRRVAILGPTYGEYAASFARADGMVDPVASVEAIGDGHGAAVIVNPNNPDGRVVSRETLCDLADGMAARSGLLIVDEAFADLEPGASVAGEAGRRDALIVLKSFGKFFGLAGLRLGFAIGPDALMDRLEAMLGPWAVSGPALAIARHAFMDEALPGAIRASIRERSVAMEQVLRRAGLSIAGGAGLFHLVQDERAHSLHEALCRRHILVRRFDYDQSWLRFGLAPDAAGDARLSAALAEFRGGG